MDSRIALAIDTAKLYYVEGLSQSEVAGKLGVSRPTVSKLLTLARDAGYVRIEIDDPRTSSSILAERLKQAFGLTEARVVPAITAASGATVNDAPSLSLMELGKIGAQLLDSLVSDGDLIGVSWGNTLHAIANQLHQKTVTGVRIVQLKGGLSHSAHSTNDFDTISKFSEAFYAPAHLLPLPAVFQSAEVKRLVEQEPFIEQLTSLARESTIAVFTVGAASPDSTLLQLGYFSDADVERILVHAVGDICSRWVTADGEIAVPEIDARSVGISLADLRKVPVRLLVAGGLEKAAPLRVALEKGMATHLVTDATVAEHILQTL
ncbi:MULTISPECIES: sugar-binding transcriptional regulator [Corynebacterium]|uniref:sugar-binding transcriptional regulator n=1 Tax=Corynebacterium TaxID=1716 RepID=UPI00019C1A49|nr:MULTISPECIES: sugar-binding transcriptional regulator [Corynebacterium]EEI26384.1 putative sugar-binding domain protein [Corynebacterium glucuronolyticum ATCC 51867]MCT1442508.1 sugar-binding transcriptional regulator [Corynebacterium glucuronolyticum]OFO43407.1 RNA polymerase subunit sigma-70 [Corynebacterium sp. HMSC073D01]QQU87429.1 sugar-binding transcriptional regulator [Corynebacterium glucuronolyticum]QRO83312.1 sugar-binding transcriptional regulator [Corynebacterium glucuronolyticu